MYGLLLEGIKQFICYSYGSEAWSFIAKQINLDINSFSIHEIYDEEILTEIIEKAVIYCGVSKNEIMFQNGKYFIGFLSQYEYDSILRVLGRDLRGFLNGLDNLHEYLKYSYAQLKPPSFYCTNESQSGITIQYRSKRDGFVHYVRGQIVQIAEVFYNTKVAIEIIGENHIPNYVYNFILRLHFDNPIVQNDNNLFPPELFFQVFPFNIVFNRGLRIVNCGKGMKNLVPNIIGNSVENMFDISRPIIEISWDSVSSLDIML